ncbi:MULTISPECIES: tyrosinase cofactor [Streptomyces]|uniref:tyrosinase cofactor n=1 Tax=Streptomyces TaxID=1883 RepID=UPI00210D861F|nr:tyrosinase cofactor [Streptomyces longispororuber]MCQ4213148.1 tyrosinase cofactor [Streptomyces longispororuber]
MTGLPDLPEEMVVNSRVSLTYPRPAESVAAPAATGRAPDGRPLLTRRSATLILLGAASTTAAVLQLRPSGTDEPGTGPESFDETYLGRRITGVRSSDAAAGGVPAWQVAVDGRPLHLMRRADGSYLSMVDHYASYPTPLDAARGAVAELGDQQLRPHVGGM